MLGDLVASVIILEICPYPVYACALSQTERKIVHHGSSMYAMDHRRQFMMNFLGIQH